MQLFSNIGQTLEVLLAIHGVAVAIVNLTPTPKDDVAVAKSYRLIEIMAGIFTKRVKQ